LWAVTELAALAVEQPASAMASPNAVAQALDADPETSSASSFPVPACLDFPWLTPVSLNWVGVFNLKDITSRRTGFNLYFGA